MRVTALSLSPELKFGNVGFCGGRKTGEPEEKPSERGKNEQQTQSTHQVAPGWNQTWTTLVGDERSHPTASSLLPGCPRNTVFSELIKKLWWRCVGQWKTAEN